MDKKSNLAELNKKFIVCIVIVLKNPSYSASAEALEDSHVYSSVVKNRSVVPMHE